MYIDADKLGRMRMHAPSHGCRETRHATLRKAHTVNKAKLRSIKKIVCFSKQTGLIGMILGVVFLQFMPTAHGQVYAYFSKMPVYPTGGCPGTSSTLNYCDFVTYVIPSSSVGGITVEIPWQTYDNGTTGPNLNTTNLHALEQNLMHTVGSGQKVNLIIEAASGGVGNGGINKATPAYVFGTTWAGTSPPVDVCFCNNYQGSLASGWMNMTVGSNCYNQNNFATRTGGLTWDYSGVPAAWEQPFVSAYTQWLASFLPTIASDLSALGVTLGYVRIGVGTGGGSYVACPNVEAGSYNYGGVTQSYAPVIPLSLSVWQGYSQTVYSYVSNLSTGILLEASFYGGNGPLGAGDGNTTIQWADAEAQWAIGNGLGIGAESLQSSDLTAYATLAACSNDWCNLFNEYSLSGLMLGLQTVDLSNPSCIASPSTCGSQTGSLVTVLPFGTQRHATVFELGYADLICAYSPNGASEYPGTCPVTYPYTPYINAVMYAAEKQPNSTASLVGGALSPSASLP